MIRLFRILTRKRGVTNAGTEKSNIRKGFQFKINN